MSLCQSLLCEPSLVIETSLKGLEFMTKTLTTGVEIKFKTKTTHLHVG